jgi:hypothetical protein
MVLIKKKEREKIEMETPPPPPTLVNISVLAMPLVNRVEPNFEKGYVIVYFPNGASVKIAIKELYRMFYSLKSLSIVNAWWLSKMLANFDDFRNEDSFLSNTAEKMYSVLDTKLHDSCCLNPRGDGRLKCEVGCLEKTYLTLTACAIQVFSKELENIFVGKELLEIILRLYHRFAQW